MTVQVMDWERSFRVELKAETWEDGALLLTMAAKAKHSKGVVACKMWVGSNPPRLAIDIAKAKGSRAFIGAML